MPERQQPIDPDVYAIHMVQTMRDSQDALTYALVTAMGIPSRMIETPNANRRVYPKELITREFREMSERLRQHKIKLDLWPGRFEHPESPGARAWCHGWSKPVAAVDWHPPSLKPPSQWKLRQIWGVRGDIVPISTEPLPKHEQTTLHQNRRNDAVSGTAYYQRAGINLARPAVVESGGEPRALQAPGAALRDDGQPQSGQDNAGQGDRDEAA